MCTFLWWPILYIYILLVTYSALFDGLFCTHISPRWYIFYKYLLAILYTIDFCSLFCLFYFFWRAYNYLRYFMTCTYLWWPLLYTYLIFVTYSLHIELFKFWFCVEISLCFTYFLQVLPLNDLVCTLLIFRTYSVHIHIFLTFCIQGIFWWTILYTYLLLVTSSGRKELFDGLLCTLNSPCLRKFY